MFRDINNYLEVNIYMNQLHLVKKVLDILLMFCRYMSKY